MLIAYAKKIDFEVILHCTVTHKGRWWTVYGYTPKDSYKKQQFVHYVNHLVRFGKKIHPRLLLCNQSFRITETSVKEYAFQFWYAVQPKRTVRHYSLFSKATR